MNKKLALVCVLGALFAAPFVSALTLEDLQSQIQDLLKKINILQQERSTTVQSDTESDIAVTAVPRLCKIFTDRTLSLGMKNDDVKGLQEFLQGEGKLKAEATGYFGVATRSALRNWQIENNIIGANASAGAGIMGPRTREALLKRCGDKGVVSVSPKGGPAPLTVVVTARVGDDSEYRPSFVDGQDTLIDFGDETERQWVHCETVKNDQFGGQITGGTCRTPQEFKHTYEKDGTYTIRLLQSGGMCIGGCPERLVGTAHVTVGAIACTGDYTPVCGMKQVVCIKAPCNPIPTTYANKCAMAADGATYAYSGACRSTGIDPASDPQCKAWYDGCNSCSRQGPGQPAVCTLRACSPDTMQKPYCSAYFDDTPRPSRPPVISEFTGPVSLNLNETGTWSVRASDPENQPLTYSINWGDEWYVLDANKSFAPTASIQQTSTFQHAFSNAGAYTVRIKVTDINNQSTDASASVQVGTTAYCTKEYVPVCGRPAGCANTCPPGMYCTLECRLHEPVTYSNMCMLRADGASFMQSGVCPPPLPAN